MSWHKRFNQQYSPYTFREDFFVEQKLERETYVVALWMDSLRLQTYSDLKALYELSTSHVTELEAYIFRHACKKQVLCTTEGPELWSYSTGHSLYATERYESHLREMIASYLTTLENVKEIANLYLQNAVTINHESFFEFLNQENFLHEQKSSFATWKRHYEEEQQKIKKTLEQRETIASVGAPQQFIKCRKCKSDHVDVEQKQTRSADEPMTLFCQCRDCGTRFVMS